jgi:hypothetical protein
MLHVLDDVFSWSMAAYFAAINVTYTALLVLARGRSPIGSAAGRCATSVR